MFLVGLIGASRITFPGHRGHTRQHRNQTVRLYWVLKRLVGAGLLLTLGVACTGLFVNDGLDRLTEHELAFVPDALAMAQGCFDHPFERVLGRKFQIVELKLVGYCAPEGLPPRLNYRAVLRSYTLFGIPTGTITVNCGTGVCRGWFSPAE